MFILIILVLVSIIENRRWKVVIVKKAKSSELKIMGGAEKIVDASAAEPTYFYTYVIINIISGFYALVTFWMTWYHNYRIIWWPKG